MWGVDARLPTNAKQNIYRIPVREPPCGACRDEAPPRIVQPATSDATPNSARPARLAEPTAVGAVDHPDRIKRLALGNGEFGEVRFDRSDERSIPDQCQERAMAHGHANASERLSSSREPWRPKDLLLRAYEERRSRRGEQRNAELFGAGVRPHPGGRRVSRLFPRPSLLTPQRAVAGRSCLACRRGEA